MGKKQVSFSPLCKQDTENVIETPRTPRYREKYDSDYNIIKAHQVGCRMESEIKQATRISFRVIAEERADLLLCLAKLYHQCPKIYRLDDKSLLQLCRALSYMKK